MIEINLLPGSAKRQKQRLPALSAGAFSSISLPKFDRAIALIVLAWVVGLGGTGFMHLRTGSRISQLELDVQAAQRDSARLHNLRVLNDSLKKQIDDIGARLNVLQQIDAGRFTWAHILDEVSRALPQYTWLVNITEAAKVEGEPGLPRVKIEGRTGNTFALARFMQDLEASVFLRNVTILSQTQTSENDRVLYEFVLEMDYEEPPPDAIETEPLFGEVEAIAAAPDSTAADGEGN